MVIHGDEAEQVVIGLGHRLGGPVLVHRPYFELLEVTAVGVGSSGLAAGLISFEFGHGPENVRQRTAHAPSSPAAHAPRAVGRMRPTEQHYCSSHAKPP